MREAITEASRNIISGWDIEADGITLATLPAFLRKLTEDYEHDYGTICHAIAVAAVATAKAVNRTEQGGITGFQARAVFWEFYRRWLEESGPASLVQYEKMLYPQGEEYFSRTISKGAWGWLQAEAKKKLSDDNGGGFSAELRDHWQSIVDGKVPFGYTVRD